MNVKEELTTLLMESYDRGVEDAKQEALIALEKVVAVAVAKEREACAEICDRFQARDVGMQPAECAGAIRARGNT